MINLTNENFEKEVISSKKPILVDFWASWCGPCQMIAPIVEEISNELSERIEVGKINVDEQPEIAIKYDVMSIPTLILFKDGKVVNTIIGYHSKEEILDFINSRI
jgi:thioredoxin 1